MKCIMCNSDLVRHEASIKNIVKEKFPKQYLFYRNESIALYDDINAYFNSLILDSYSEKSLKPFSLYDYNIEISSNINCLECGINEFSTLNICLTEMFHNYLNTRIEYLFNKISIQNLGYGIFNDIFGDYTDLNEKILIDLVPDTNNIKNEITKLLEINDFLPLPVKGRERFGGHGGFDFEPLEWLLTIITEQLVSYIIGYIAINGIEKGAKKIKEFIHGVKVKQIIRRKIKEHDETWNEISLDEFEKYISFPKKFNGNKDELIEKIVEKKCMEYIERIKINIKNKEKVRSLPVIHHGK